MYDRIIYQLFCQLGHGSCPADRTLKGELDQPVYQILHQKNAEYHHDVCLKWNVVSDLE